MGKGDKKSKKGKIAQGSFGNSRLGKTGRPTSAPVPEVKPEA